MYDQIYEIGFYITEIDTQNILHQLFNKVFVGVVVVVEIIVCSSLSIKQSELASISAHYQAKRSHAVEMFFFSSRK